MARERGETDLAPEADLDAVEAIIDAAFWASLRREEGYTPTISLAFLPPDRAVRPLTFEPLGSSEHLANPDNRHIFNFYAKP
jgi:hypothetical protein